MVVYLAGKPDDHEVFAQRAKELADNASLFGHSVSIVSMWHNNSNLAEGIATARRVHKSLTISTEDFMGDRLRAISKPVRISDLELSAAARLDEAIDQCLHGLEQADVVIADMNGGAVEAGYGIAKGKRVLTIGEMNSPLANGIESGVKSFETWAELMAHLISPANRCIYQ